MANIGTLMAHLGIDTSDLKRAEREFKSSTGTMEKGVSGLKSSFASLGSTLVGIFGIYEIAKYSKEVVMLADNYTLLRNQLKLVTSSDLELSGTMSQLQKIAADTWADLGTTVSMYSRMARAAEALGINENELIGVTRTLNETIAISGASSIEAKNALIQFSQGLQSNRLSGEELRAVMEQLPGLAIQIAKGMEIPYGQLKLMAQEGKVDARAVVDALIKQRDEIHSLFSDMDITIGYSMTNIKTNFGAVVDDINRGLSGTGSIAASFQWFADLLRDFHESGAATEWAYAMTDAFSAFSLGLIDSWNYAEYGLKAGFEGVRYSWDLIISGMQETFANYINFVASGYSKIPFVGDQLAATWINVASGLRTTGEAITEHEGRLAGLRGELDRNLSVTDEMIDEIHLERYAVDKTSGSVKKLGDNFSKTNVVSEEAKKAADKHAKALESVLNKYLPLEDAIETMNTEQSILNELHRDGILVGERYAIAMGNFTVETKRAALAEAGLTEAMMDTGKSYDVMQSEFQQGTDVLTKEIEDTTDLVENEFGGMTEYISDRWKEAYDGMQNILSDWIKNGEVSFDSVLDLFKNMLAEMLAAWIMNIGKMVIADLFGIGSSSGITGALGGLFGSSSSGGGLGTATSLIGTGYQMYAGESIWATLFGGLGGGGGAAGGAGATGGGLGIYTGSSIGAGGAATGGGAAAGGTAAGGGAAGGSGIGLSSVASVALPVGVVAGALFSMYKAWFEVDPPSFTELLNNAGIGPEAFAFAVGDTFTQGMNPVYGALDGFMMDAESMILTRSQSMMDGAKLRAEEEHDFSMSIYDQATGSWRQLGAEVMYFDAMAERYGKETAAAMVEAKTGISGLGEEFANISNSTKTSLDEAIESLEGMGISGQDLNIVLSEVTSILQGTTKGTDELRESLYNMGLASDQVDKIISELGLDAYQTANNLMSSGDAWANLVFAVTGGLQASSASLSELDYGLGNIESIADQLATTLTRTAAGFNAADDAAYNFNDSLGDFLGDHGQTPTPPPTSPSDLGDGSMTMTVNVTIPATDLINKQELTRTIRVQADQIRVQADRSNMKGKPIVIQ